jgi:hypothetical protein
MSDPRQDWASSKGIVTTVAVETHGAGGRPRKSASNAVTASLLQQMKALNGQYGKLKGKTELDPRCKAQINLYTPSRSAGGTREDKNAQ